MGDTVIRYGLRLLISTWDEGQGPRTPPELAAYAANLLERMLGGRVRWASLGPADAAFEDPNSPRRVVSVRLSFSWNPEGATDASPVDLRRALTALLSGLGSEMDVVDSEIIPEGGE